MEHVLYTDYRSEIATGDLLIWKKSKISIASDILLHAIRFLTTSDFAHVAIAYKEVNRLFVVEATMPKVQIVPVSQYEEFYHIKMDAIVTDDAREELLSKVGMAYGIMDCIRSYLGITLAKDDRWQCAELANYFYKSVGLDFGNAMTPTDLVEAVLETGKSLRLVRNTK